MASRPVPLPSPPSSALPDERGERIDKAKDLIEELCEHLAWLKADARGRRLPSLMSRPQWLLLRLYAAHARLL